MLPAIGRQAAPQNRVKPILGTRDSKETVSLKCATPGAALEYSLDGTTWQPYTTPFALASGTVSVRATSAGMLAYEGAICLADQKPAHADWKIVEVSSFEPGEGDAKNAIDGNPDTFWHSRWSGDPAQPPHFLVVDFSKQLNVSAVVYTARADSRNGHIKDYEIYLSDDAKNLG